MCPEETITASQVSIFLGQTVPRGPAAENNDAMAAYGIDDFKEAKKLFEKEYLAKKLAENDNNITKTAELVGIERSHLHKKLKALELV